MDVTTGFLRAAFPLSQSWLKNRCDKLGWVWLWNYTQLFTYDWQFVSQWACCFIPQIIPQIKGRIDIYTTDFSLYSVWPKTRDQAQQLSRKVLTEVRTESSFPIDLYRTRGLYATTTIARYNAGLQHFHIDLGATSMLHISTETNSVQQLWSGSDWLQLFSDRLAKVWKYLSSCSYVTVFGRNSVLRIWDSGSI